MTLLTGKDLYTIVLSAFGLWKKTCAPPAVMASAAAGSCSSASEAMNSG